MDLTAGNLDREPVCRRGTSDISRAVPEAAILSLTVKSPHGDGGRIIIIWEDREHE
jgi:hypothetical protein